MPDARNLPGCSAAGSPAARGAEGGRRPAARRCPSMGSPESSGGGGPCAEAPGGCCRRAAAEAGPEEGDGHADR